MNKKFFKIIGIILSVILVCVSAVFLNAFFGNPVSKALATSTAKKYISETYPDTDYYIEKVGYNFKFSDYYAVVKSPSSIDTVFQLHLSMLGELGYDTFENVTNRFTTAQRLETEYRALVASVLEDEAFPYTADIAFGTLEIYPGEDIESENTDVPSYAIDQRKLELDKNYDINELGKRAGTLVIYVDSDTVTAEEAAEVMLEIRRLFDEAGVCFVAMDFTLQHPKPEEGIRPDEYIGTEDFLYDDIIEEGLSERVAEADRALKLKYEEMDKEAAVSNQGVLQVEKTNR